MRRFRVIFLLSILMPAFFSQSAYAAAAAKIGYVDVAFVFDGYDKTKEEDAKLGEKSQEKQAQRDKMIDKIKNMKTELELLSEKQKEKKQSDIDNEIRKLQDFDRDGKAELQRDRDDMVKVLLKDIETVINEYAIKNEYTMILNARVLEYALEEYNITNEVLNLLNSKYRRNSR